ncbi:MAG: type 1 glutamine amidotransferase [Candidatus Eremiobacteraeota bacterium]|nr:type 1 glutamine amidotransferase [Candidatus Eremiobacteraeota bacterium]MCW5865885.1 type 1 glutamine amidotransferase [Candidatus Eremiobacteraeota bacterium]
MKKIAMLMTQDFEDSEARKPYEAMKEAGFQVDIVAPQAGQTLQGKKGEFTIKSDLAISRAQADDYAMLVIPGGHSPESLRLEEGAVEFVKAFGTSGKPIAAICHGPQLLISAGLVRERKMTCYKAVAIDLKNAGARYEDSALVVDGPFITSRTPEDLPQFCEAILQALRTQPAHRQVGR